MGIKGDSERASQARSAEERSERGAEQVSIEGDSERASQARSAEERSERGAEQVSIEGDSERASQARSESPAEHLNAPATNELRERTRQQLLDSFGGWSGTVISAIPLVVFVAVNAVAGLRTAIWSAVLAAVLLAGYRLLRRQSVQQAVGGLFSVLIAAAIAAHTGQARGYFLLGIAGSILYGGVFAITLIVRRPLVGLLWEFLDPAPLPDGVRWYRVAQLRRAYDLATLAGLAMFAARAVVQLSLFRDNRTGWLAVTRIVMGFPLYLAVLAFGFWVVRRARLGLPRPADEPIVDPLEGSAEDRPAP